ncbi:hypothetical protein [Algoriphagus aquimarinus]|uniref:Uncharacterized protein n=1 Tax=Algoriphagus aquimarinus TaxID=237018 RepID=A0A5C7AR71_9BACT|nr:hypothetical protein [Algoriphagus aquimarinus]TXE10209.1 hypothetical protein ESV85_12780 [Algoriphagus aquimarinus]
MVKKVKVAISLGPRSSWETDNSAEEWKRIHMEKWSVRHRPRCGLIGRMIIRPYMDTVFTLA